MSGGDKTKITCYGCQASYLLDLATAPPELRTFNCLECGGEIPILARVLSDPTPEPAPASPPAPAAQGGHESDLMLNRDRGLVFPSEEDPAWPPIYAGVMSLLLVLLVLLLAGSAGDRRRFATVVGGVSRALGGHVSFPAGGSSGPGAAAPAASTALVRSPAGNSRESHGRDQLGERLRDLVARDPMHEAVAVRDQPRGWAVMVQDQAMFDSGSAEIRPGMRPLLLRLGRLLRGLDNQIVVEGHTDSPPPGAEGLAPGWELSMARSAKVVQVLSDQGQLDPARITAADYVHFRPPGASDAPDNVTNRRMAIVVLRRPDSEPIRGPFGGQPPPGSGTR